MRYGLLTWVVLVTAVAFAVRTVLVLVLRRRYPRLADVVDRWWPWTPVVVVVVAITIACWWAGLLTAAVLALKLRQGAAVGSPFRPRR